MLAPSFTNVPDILSIPAALSESVLFKRFRICSSTQLSKVIFPFLVIISLYYLMNILVVPHVFIPQDVATNVLGKINFK